MKLHLSVVNRTRTRRSSMSTANAEYEYERSRDFTKVGLRCDAKAWLAPPSRWSLGSFGCWFAVAALLFGAAAFGIR